MKPNASLLAAMLLSLAASGQASEQIWRAPTQDPLPLRAPVPAPGGALFLDNPEDLVPMSLDAQLQPALPVFRPEARLQTKASLSGLVARDENGKAGFTPEDHRQLYLAMTQTPPPPAPEPEQPRYEDRAEAVPAAPAAIEEVSSRNMAAARQNVDRHPASSRRAGAGAVRLAGAELHKQMLGRSVRGVKDRMTFRNGHVVADAPSHPRPQAPAKLVVKAPAQASVEAQPSAPLKIETHYLNARMQRTDFLKGKELPVYEVGDQMRFQYKVTNTTKQTMYDVKVESQDEKVLSYGRAGRKLNNRDEAWTVAKLAPGQTIILNGAHDIVADHMATGLQQMHVTVKQGDRVIQDTPDAGYIDP